MTYDVFGKTLNIAQLNFACIHQMAPPEHTSYKQACYSFIDLGRIKG